MECASMLETHGTRTCTTEALSHHRKRGSRLLEQPRQPLLSEELSRADALFVGGHDIIGDSRLFQDI